jgi:hypothetical protein
MGDMSDSNTQDEPEATGTTRRSFLGSLGAGSGVLYLGELTNTDNHGVGHGTQKVKVYAGAADNRPEVTKGNRLYIAIDTGRRFYDTGSEWQQLDIAAPAGEFETVTIAELTVGDITSTVGDDLASDHNEYNPHFPRLAEQSGPPVIQPHPGVSNPVLTGDDVTDLDAQYTADPFIVYEDGTYHMFFEVFPETRTESNATKIGHATSKDGLDWTYDQIVLDSDPTHLAFPYVFKWDNEWYMMPDKGSDPLAEIYHASSFPTEWELVARPFTDQLAIDPMPIYWEGTWYLFSASDAGLELHYSDDFVSESWTPHPESPVHTGTTYRRGGGRPITHEDYIDLFVQDTTRVYGDKVRILRVTNLTKDSYADREVASSPIVEASLNDEWNDISMHQVDALMPYVGGNDIVAVDGRGPTSDDWKIGIFTIGESGPTAAKAFLSESQTLESRQSTTIELDTRAHDMSQSFSVDDYQYTVPKSGYYRVEGQITLTDMRTDGHPFTLTSRLHNTTTGSAIAEQHTQVVASGTVSSLAGTTAYLNEGTTVQLAGHQNTKHQLTVAPDASTTYLTIRRIR